MIKSCLSSDMFRLKIMQKKLIYTTTIIFFILLMIGYSLAMNNWRIRDAILEYRHDRIYRNKAVTTKQQIDKVYTKFEQLNYSELEDEYLDYTKSNIKTYKPLVSNLNYVKIKRKDLNKYIVGRYRVKDFICKDKFYKQCVRNKSDAVTCALNKKIFYKTLELQQELEKNGYNKSGFRVVNGHRHPRYNERVGGAKKSHHIKGEAVDISIRDIDKDGKSTKKDKDIVLDILEKKVIRNEGGLGLYPGTQSVHYDVRGVRARWNSY